MSINNSFLKILALLFFLAPTISLAEPVESKKDLSEKTIQEELNYLDDNQFVIFSDASSTNIYIQASATGDIVELEAVSEKYSSPKISDIMKTNLAKLGWVVSETSGNYIYPVKRSEIKGGSTAKFILNSFKAYNIEPGHDIKIAKDSF